MSVQPIIDVMNKMCTMHESLLALSRTKSEFLKEGDAEGLQKLLPKENQHVRAIEKLEQERIKLTDQWFAQHAEEEPEKTLTNILKHLRNDKEKDDLKGLYEKFVIILADLKQQEQLNRELTRQSLQFVELSLDMLQPSAKSLNYGKEKGSRQNTQTRSIFDSKA